MKIHEDQPNWTSWAYNKADWVDPTIGKEDNITGFYKDFN